jgi:hypothetical protein
VSSFAAPLNGDGTFQNVTRNFVRGVRSSTAIWRVADLKADVFADGRVRVEGHGLLLASGDRIGQNASQNVFATLICEPVAPFVERSSAATVNGIEFLGQVPLEANGDFRIDDTLKVPGGVGDPVPLECPSPVLLIRANNGAWLAAGIPKIANNH